MSKCLFCYQELDPGQVDFHPACARKVFGMSEAPRMPYTRDNMSELARKVVLKNTPRLHFKLDETAANADRVMSILHELDMETTAKNDTEDTK